MKKTLLVAAMALAAYATSTNAADLKQYTSLKANYSMMKNDVKQTAADPDDNDKWNIDDKVAGASIAYGIKSGAFRTELEANVNLDSEKTYDDLKNTLKNNSLFLNAYYDIATGSKFTPYVGAGVGVSRLKVEFKDDNDKYTKSSTNFAWQVGAGVSYAMTEAWALDLGYRYMDNGDVTLNAKGDKVKTDSQSHNVSLGLRYTF